ncbi:phage baseplate assembly protein V [Allokutzneria sp. NRRL B-24872]|uniref:phage baseplate assembly protein V n=1 Tax=Allokutzneria sp. NRRL B-24872 TaxID=1137961 RepID=UPI000A38D1D9|nr:phage baseplate assembly protein V [Allokutzneria sp. NRRL B-24872]
MINPLGLLGNTPDGESVRAVVLIGQLTPMPLSLDTEHRIRRVVVDNDANLPGMFEITFEDPEGWLVDRNGYGIGCRVAVHDGRSGNELIEGEVTSIEARCADGLLLTVLRGYEKAHRLQRAKRSRTFLYQLDCVIAARIAAEHGLSIGLIEPTTRVHAHLAQVQQTDWEFLQWRASEIGFETGVAGGKFYFRKPVRPGGLLIGIARTLFGRQTTVEFKKDLLSFHPRLTAASLTPDVEVRVWDPWACGVRVGRSELRALTAKIADDAPANLAKIFIKSPLIPLAIPKPPVPPVLSALGVPMVNPEPSPTAHVVVDQPVATGIGSGGAANDLAEAIGDRMVSGYAEAEGRALGNALINAGGLVKVSGVPRQFEGTWAVTSARHVFDDSEGGYITHFTVSGKHDRSPYGLTSGVRPQAPRINGVVCGVVSSITDLFRRNRVKVTLPWLSPTFETDWARVVSPGAGVDSGTLFLPSVGDEVLVAFEFGDVRRPYVLGGLINSKTSFDVSESAVLPLGPAASVMRRGISTPKGNQLLFEDTLVSSKVSLGNKDDCATLTLDSLLGTATLSATPAVGAGGRIVIECGGAGVVQINAGPAGAVTVDGGAVLNLTAKAAVRIASDGIVQIKGTMVEIN